ILTNNKITNYPQSLRVSAEDYQNNLQAITDFAKQKGVEVIFIKMPVNLPVATKITEAQLSQSDHYLSLGKQAVQSGDYDWAQEHFKQAIRHNPYSVEALYLLGICSERQGRPKQASGYFKQEKKAEAYRCGSDAIRYNAIMQALAKQNGLPLVDIVKAFSQNNDQYLFISPDQDPIHPNVAGHKIIAEQLYASLIKNELLPK
ncbi:tetratricopeptide repeat protein, partial [Candidatus Omnitrophota bacterium]